MATHFAQNLQVAGAFDPFGNDGQAQAARHGNDRLHQGAFITIVLHVLDEGFVDLEGFERETLEIGKRRVAGAKIIEIDAQPHAVDSLQPVQCFVDIVEQNAFGDFERQILWGDAVALQGGGDCFGGHAVRDLAPGNVDRQIIVLTGALPLQQLLTGAFQYPQADFVD